MEVLLEACCGIDVHLKTITVCLMVGKPHEKPKKNHQNLYDHDPGPLGV